jgi:GxxExxY protein
MEIPRATPLKKSNLLLFLSTTHPGLSVIFDIFREIWQQEGEHCTEFVYQKAFAKECRDRKIECNAEAPTAIMYKDEQISGGRIDFLVTLPTAASENEEKSKKQQIIIETKAIKKITDENLPQLRKYLQQKKLPLGILINFPPIMTSQLPAKLIVNAAYVKEILQQVQATGELMAWKFEDEEWLHFDFEVSCVEIPRYHKMTYIR